MAINTTTTQSTQKNTRKFILSTAIILALGILVGMGVYLLNPLYISAYNITERTRQDISGGDTAWVLAATALVMVMSLGVGFFYGGMVRSKNVISTIKYALIILALVSIQWVLIGYTLVFGPTIGGGIIGGLNYIGLIGVGYAPNSHYAKTIPQLAFMSFHAMFAIITPAIIIGAFVGRIRFRTFIVFLFF